MNIDRIPIGDDPPSSVSVIIEVPVGGEPVKYEFDKGSRVSFVDRILHTPMRSGCGSAIGATSRKPSACSGKLSNAARRGLKPTPEGRKGDFDGRLCYNRREAWARERPMDSKDKIYFARRAAEEQELAAAARDPDVAEAHRKLQRAYLERASVGDRPVLDAGLVIRS